MILELVAVAAFGILLGLRVRAPAVLVCTGIIFAATAVAVFLGKADTATALDIVFAIIVFHGSYLVGVFVREAVRSLRDR